MVRRCSGSPEGAASLAGVWWCPPAPKGRPEGIVPSGRRSGGCPSRPPIIFPLPGRKGARGMVRATIEAAPLKQESNGAAVQRECRGRRPLPGVWWCPPAPKGRPEGIAPSGRRSGGCPSRALLFFPPFLEGRGPGGWSLNPTYAAPRCFPAGSEHPPGASARSTPRYDPRPRGHSSLQSGSWPPSPGS